MTPTISRENYIDLLNQDRLIPKIIETKSETTPPATACRSGGDFFQA